MTMAKTRNKFSRKALVIALAAGVSFGGVAVPQIAGAEGVTAVASADAGTIHAGEPVELKLTRTAQADTLIYKTQGGTADGKSVNVYIVEDRPEAYIPYEFSAEFLTDLGIDVSKPFTISETNSLRSLSVVGDGGTQEKGVDDGTEIDPAVDAPGGLKSLVATLDTATSYDPSGFGVSQGDETTDPELLNTHIVKIVRADDWLGVNFSPASASTVKAGETVTTKPAGTSELSSMAGIRFSLKTPVEGASVNAKTGSLTYTPPATSEGGAVEVTVEARMGGDTIPADSPLDYVSGGPYTAEMTYKFHVEPQSKPDLHVSHIKKDDKGNYIVTRSDGKTWTIELKDIRDKIAELENKDTVSPEDLKKVQDDLDKINDEIKDLKTKDDALQKEIDQLKKDVEDLDKRVTDLEGRVTKLEGSVIKEVRDNGDGTYTLIREDGSEVKGKIDTSGSVTDIKPDGKGNLIVTIDGKDQTVPLDQVKITESKKGTPEHTVTITTPDGQSVTFNVFDNYVVDVKREEDGNYKIVRNDGTEWTINLKDIRDKIAELEAKDSPSRDEFNAVKDEIDDLKKEIDDLKAVDETIKGDITNIKNDITNLDIRITKIESRLSKVEDHTDALTKCVAGAGTAGIPALLSIPLMMMAQLNIPGIKDLNTQIQKQIGIYDENLARQWERSGGVLQAGAVLAGLAGIIGGISYIAKQCDPMMKSDAGKNTDLGKLSSKLEKKDLGSSTKDNGKAKNSSSAKKNTEADQPDKQDAPTAEEAAEAEAETKPEAATAPSEELVDAQ